MGVGLILRIEKTFVVALAPQQKIDPACHQTDTTFNCRQINQVDVAEPAILKDPRTRVNPREWVACQMLCEIVLWPHAFTESHLG